MSSVSEIEEAVEKLSSTERREFDRWWEDRRSVEMKARFADLADEWRRETSHFSNPAKRILHPAYQKIISLGRAALPHILSDLKETRDHWFWALRVISGESVATNKADSHETIAESWISWGEKNAYL